MTSLFIFTRDLRIYDNTALLQCLLKSKIVIPCFVFTPEQIGGNEYKSDNCVQFMIESVKDLDMYIRKVTNNTAKLNIFIGKVIDILQEHLNKFQSVYITHDYTSYAINRCENIRKWCEENGKKFHEYKDYLLHDNILNKRGRTYKRFLPYYIASSKIPVKKPGKIALSNFEKFVGLPHINKIPRYKINKNIFARGGRMNCLKLLKHLSKDDTGLSAYIKFGCISIREVYFIFSKCGNENSIKQLYWRDFYYGMSFDIPILDKWDENETNFNKWCEGKTEDPVVDAGMKELNTTGYINNKTRLAVAKYLVKKLRINWVYGEKYFANKLIDYDPCINRGNWLWIVRTNRSETRFRI